MVVCLNASTTIQCHATVVWTNPACNQISSVIPLLHHIIMKTEKSVCPLCRIAVLNYLNGLKQRQEMDPTEQKRVNESEIIPTLMLA